MYRPFRKNLSSIILLFAVLLFFESDTMVCGSSAHGAFSTWQETETQETDNAQVQQPADEPPTDEVESPGALEAASFSLQLPDKDAPRSQLRSVISRYHTDRRILERYWAIEQSPSRQERFRRFYHGWLEALQALDVESFSEMTQTDYYRLRGDIYTQLGKIDSSAVSTFDTEKLVPFRTIIVELVESQAMVERVDPIESARQVSEVARLAKNLVAELSLSGEVAADRESTPLSINTAAMKQAVFDVTALHSSLRSWFAFYDGYDPLFNWWVAHPYNDANRNLERYIAALKKQVGDEGETEPSEPQNRFERRRGGGNPSDSSGSGERAREAGRSNESRNDSNSDRSRQQTEDNVLFSTTTAIEWPTSSATLESTDTPVPSRLSMGLAGDSEPSTNEIGYSNGTEKKNKARLPSRELIIEDVPDLKMMMAMQPSRMEPIFDRYRRELQQRGFRQPQSRRGREQYRTQLGQWLAALKELDYDSLTVSERVDYHLLRNRIESSIKRLDLSASTDEVVSDETGIRGRPIGREALQVELEMEMIAYSPDELIEIAHRELAWCRQELIKASHELGFGDDWRKAVEHVKSLHLAPGEQPFLVRQLSDEAVKYLREHDLLTIPPLANETWRMRMMSPQQQLITPFFTGGEVVTVGFPTNTMAHEAKLQSLRGNNIHFSRATVHHELIPGHGLQAFMVARYGTHRQGFGTPFWMEGWALYWEMVLYDRGFAQTPEDRIGFLVWRSHRCARIIFSLSFHLGWMTINECVDFLVANVGFERLGAEGEVRRSFGGMYPPLYQAAYMLGGLQLRNLHEVVVKSGKTTDKEFHDQVLQQGSIPIEMIRAILLNEPLDRDHKANWRFYRLE
jgi:hypothetical protein